MTEERPLVALISAVTAAIPPAQSALAGAFPDARVWNILDDRLLEDAAAEGGVTPELSARMLRLIDHARTEGADGVLLTCSMYGPVAHRVADQAGIPVFGPDDAVFAAARDGGYHRILVISSAEGPLADSVSRLRDVVGNDTHVDGAVAIGAAASARAGDVPAVAAAIGQAVSSAATAPDAVLLGQYSLSPAAEAVADSLGLPVLAGPQYAAAELQRQIGNAHR